MLEVNHITVQYGLHEPALKDFSMQLKPGQVISLVGESGSGKTSALNAILGLLPGNGRVTEGDILFEGKSVLTMADAEWETMRGSRIAVIPQDLGTTLDPIMTIGSQFTEYILRHEKMKKKDAWARAEEMLRLVQLNDTARVMKSYPFQLSGGMRQRVGIAMGLFFHPDYLLADEPTSALDVTTQAQIVRQIVDLRKEYEAGILLVTHNLALAAYISDEIYVLKDGQIVDHGNREDVLLHPTAEYTRNLLLSVPSIEGERYV